MPWNNFLKRFNARPAAEHLQQGKQAEEQARRYLQTRGLTLVGSNFRCARGEIDLIMQDHGTLVIVEVRYRENTQHGDPAETVTRSKQIRIIKAAQHYLAKHPNNQPVRFDVVAISGSNLNWIRGAFTA